MCLLWFFIAILCIIIRSVVQNVRRLSDGTFVYRIHYLNKQFADEWVIKDDGKPQRRGGGVAKETKSEKSPKHNERQRAKSNLSSPQGQERSTKILRKSPRTSRTTPKADRTTPISNKRQKSPKSDGKKPRKEGSEKPGPTFVCQFASCARAHSGTYGSGRFCGEQCARAFSSEKAARSKLVCQFASCARAHKGTYGSGRFCGKRCARAFSSQFFVENLSPNKKSGVLRNQAHSMKTTTTSAGGADTKVGNHTAAAQTSTSHGPTKACLNPLCKRRVGNACKTCRHCGSSFARRSVLLAASSVYRRVRTFNSHVHDFNVLRFTKF
jgi:hypothetical protein